MSNGRHDQPAPGGPPDSLGRSSSRGPHPHHASARRPGFRLPTPACLLRLVRYTPVPSVRTTLCSRTLTSQRQLGTALQRQRCCGFVRRNPDDGRSTGHFACRWFGSASTASLRANIPVDVRSRPYGTAFFCTQATNQRNHSTAYGIWLVVHPGSKEYLCCSGNCGLRWAALSVAFTSAYV